MWHASSFALVRSFLLSGALHLRRMQHTFAVSPNAELLVSAGLRLGVLLVYSLVSGTVCMLLKFHIAFLFASSRLRLGALLVYSLVSRTVYMLLKFHVAILLVSARLRL